MIHTAIENQVTWLPQSLQESIPVSLPQSLAIHLRPDNIGIEPQGVVGSIPLLNGDTIQIVPKIGTINFFRLLLKAEGMQKDLEREFEEFVAYYLDEEHNIDSIIFRQLYLAVQEILMRGPQIGRVKKQRREEFAIGKIDTHNTIFNLAARKLNPVVCHVLDRTYNIAENRILTEALIYAWPKISSADRDDFAEIYHRWILRCPRSSNLLDDLEVVEHGFAFGLYGGVRDYYRNALMLARIVLQSYGINHQGSIILQGDALLLNTADVYEKYIRSVIASAYSKFGYTVSKGTATGLSLYTDGSPQLMPDITISRHDTTLLVADAKYKSPTASDHYQINAYLQSMGISTGVLISPSFENLSVKTKERVTPHGNIVWEVYLPLHDLSSTENYLARLLTHLGP